MCPWCVGVVVLVCRCIAMFLHVGMCLVCMCVRVCVDYGECIEKWWTSQCMCVVRGLIMKSVLCCACMCLRRIEQCAC